MTEKPLVSVICTAYNHELYIRQCLEGIMFQETSFQFEVLINDDASTDNTATIIREFEVKYPRIIKPIYQLENQYSKKVGLWRDILFPRAKGKYIALCECDDYWTDPHKLQKQVEFLEVNEDFSLCFHNAKIIVENSTKAPILFRSYDKSVYTAKDNIYKWLIPTASILFRNVCLENKLPDYLAGVVHGDFALIMWLGEFGQFYFINDVMSVYRKHGTSIMTQLKNRESQKKIISQYTEMSEYFGEKYSRDFNKRISSYHLHIALYSIQQKEYKQMLQSIYVALKYDFFVFFRNKNKAEYLKYNSFEILTYALLLSLYKSQTIIRRSKLKKILLWKRS